MNAPSHENDLLLVRIERLEKQNRRMKQGGLACLLLLASIGLMAQTTTQHRRTTRKPAPPPPVVLPDNIEAQSFVLKDANGKPRAELSMSGTGPSLKLRDQNGSALVTLSLNDSAPNGAVLLMSDPQHAAGLSISVLEGAGSQVTMTGPTPDIQAHIGASADGGTIDLMDQNGFSTAIGDGMLTTKSGQFKKTTAASIALFNKDRKVLWSAP